MGGAYRGRAPPTGCLCPTKRKLCPPKRSLSPEEINRLGASGAQIEAQISVFLWTDTGFYDVFGWRPFLFFFLWDHLFSAGKTAWNSDFGRKIPWILSEYFFFLEITCFRPEKSLKFPVSAGKSLAIFAPHLVHLIQSGINFSCPRAPLEFTQNKLLVPPQNLFLPPPSHAILAPGLMKPCFLYGYCW